MWKVGLLWGLLLGKFFVFSFEWRDVLVLELEILNVWEVGFEFSWWIFFGNYLVFWILVLIYWIFLKYYKLMNKLCLWNMFILLIYIKKRLIGYFIIV